MRVLLLGASGLLGHNVLAQLVAAGHEVSALVRRAGAVHLPAEGWYDVRGELLSDADLQRAAKGCEAVINCAGVTDMSLRHLNDYRPVNATLCQRLVTLCEHCGIATIVHASSVDTIGHGTPDHYSLGTEPMREPFASSLYAQSKAEGEAVLLDAARRHAEWHVVLINPGFMIGAFDARPSSGRLLLAAYRRRLMLAPTGGKAFVAAADVAQACVAALSRGRSGMRYVVAPSEGCLSVAELYRLQASTMGYRQRVLHLCRPVAMVAAAVGGVLRLAGLRTELCPNNVRQLYEREYFDGRAAVADLGINYTPLAEAIKQFHLWRKNHL